MDKTPADLEPLSHEAARLQTPPPAQLTPGWQQVQREAEAGHTAGMCSCSLPRWFFLKKKADLSSFLSKTHVANMLAPSLAPSQEGSEAEGCPLFCPIQAIVSQNPQQLKNNNNVPAGPHRVTVHSGHPILHHHRVSTPNVSEEMGLKRSRNLSSQLPQTELN